MISSVIKQFLWFCGLYVVITLAACSQPKPSDVSIAHFNAALNENEAFGELFSQRATELGVTSASLVYRREDGQMSVLYHGVGVDERALFQAASLSKAVAAITIMTLAEMKDISLDDDIRPHTPNLDWDVINPHNRTVSLRQLLSHTAGATVSGFAGYNRGKPLPSSTDIVHGYKTRFHSTVELKSDPGQFRYSGGGYQIAQVFAEDIGEQPFADLAKSLVLAPLGMEQSTFDQPIDIETIKPRYVAGAHTRFRPKEGVFWPMKNSWRNYPEQAAAGLWTTASDYGLFVKALMQAYNNEPNAIISQDVAREALRNVDADYGLGLMIKSGPDSDISYFGHSGANTGYRCGFRADPKDGRYVVVMTNTPNGSILWREIRDAVFSE